MAVEIPSEEDEDHKKLAKAMKRYYKVVMSYEGPETFQIPDDPCLAVDDEDPEIKKLEEAKERERLENERKKKEAEELRKLQEAKQREEARKKEAAAKAQEAAKEKEAAEKLMAAKAKKDANKVAENLTKE